MIATSVDVSFTDTSNLSFEVGLTSTSKASRSLVAFKQGGRSVSEGMKTWWMAFSKGWKRSLMSGMVLDRYDHRLESP